MLPVSKFRLQLVREESVAFYSDSKPVTDSAKIRAMVQPHFDGLPHEEFIAIFLDAKLKPTGWQVISVGTLTLSIVHPREAFKAAVLANAHAVVFAHNHPSGDPTPSREDRTLTDRLVQAGEILGIRVLDHIVIGDPRYVSFSDEGWIKS